MSDRNALLMYDCHVLCITTVQLKQEGLPVHGTARITKATAVVKAVNAMKASSGASTKPGAESTWAPLE